MNIHEHQAKEVLKSFGAPVALGVAITSVDQAQAAIDALPGPLWVVKSQIHAGGRGKGTFKSGFQGGVKLCKSKANLSRSRWSRLPFGITIVICLYKLATQAISARVATIYDLPMPE